MEIMIAKSNTEIIEKFYMPKSYKLETKNTTIFNIGRRSFNRLSEALMGAGYNPYLLMFW